MAPFKRTFKKKSRKSYKRRVPNKKATVQLIKKVLHAQIEDKVATYSTTLFPLYNANHASYTTQNLMCLTPLTGYLSTVTQGVGQGQRIGNSITVRKAILKFYLSPLPYNGTTNVNPTPMDILFYIFRMKPQFDTLTDAATIVLNDFFQSNATNAGVTGNAADMTLNINKDTVTMKKMKKFKIGYALNSGTGSQQGSQYLSNNDYKMNHVQIMDITKYYPKKIVWNDTDTAPSSASLYMLFNPVPSSGTVAASTQFLTQIQYTLELTYEDA